MAAAAPASADSATLARQQVTKLGGKRRIAPVQVLPEVLASAPLRLVATAAPAAVPRAAAGVATAVTAATHAIPALMARNASALSPTPRPAALMSPSPLAREAQAAAPTGALKAFSALDLVLAGLGGAAPASTADAPGAAQPSASTPHAAQPDGALSAVAAKAAGLMAAAPTPAALQPPEVDAASVTPLGWGIEGMREALDAITSGVPDARSDDDRGRKSASRAGGLRHRGGGVDTRSTRSDASSGSSPPPRGHRRSTRDRGSRRRGSRVFVPPQPGAGQGMLASFFGLPTGAQPALLHALALQGLAASWVGGLHRPLPGVALPPGAAFGWPFGHNAGSMLPAPEQSWPLLPCAADASSGDGVVPAPPEPTGGGVPPAAPSQQLLVPTVLPAPPRLPRVTVAVPMDDMQLQAGDTGWCGHAAAAASNVTDPYGIDAAATDEVFITAYAPQEGAAASGGTDDAAAASSSSSSSSSSSLLCTQSGNDRWPARALVPGHVSVLLAASVPMCDAAGLPALLVVGGFDGCVRLLDAATGAPLSPVLVVGAGAVAHVALRVEPLCASAGSAAQPVARLVAVSCDGQLRQWRMRVAASAQPAGSAAASAAPARPPMFAPVAEVADSVAPLVASVSAALPADSGGGSSGPGPRVTLARVLVGADTAPTVQIATLRRAGVAVGEASLGFARHGAAAASGAARAAPAFVTFRWDAAAACWMRL
jgi:hypothetical protein